MSDAPEVSEADQEKITADEAYQALADEYDRKAQRLRDAGGALTELSRTLRALTHSYGGENGAAMDAADKVCEAIGRIADQLGRN